MTAPTRSRRGSGAKRREQASPTTEHAPGTEQPVKAPRRAPRTGRSSAAERAYARRAQRAELLQRGHDADREPARQKAKRRLRWPASRASFVLMMMGLLAAGVATTLWLSTQAIADSYRLEQLRAFNARQAEQAAQLQLAVTKQESAASLAQKAQALGMVPGGDPARIVVAPDGTTSLVGTPKKAQAPAPAPAPPTPPTPAPATPTPPAPATPTPAAPIAAGTQPLQGAPVAGNQPAAPANTPAVGQ
jgi:hypothetical protein